MVAMKKAGYRFEAEMSSKKGAALCPALYPITALRDKSLVFEKCTVTVTVNHDIAEH